MESCSWIKTSFLPRNPFRKLITVFILFPFVAFVKIRFGWFVARLVWLGNIYNKLFPLSSFLLLLLLFLFLKVNHFENILSFFLSNAWNSLLYSWCCFRRSFWNPLHRVSLLSIVRLLRSSGLYRLVIFSIAFYSQWSRVGLKNKKAGSKFIYTTSSTTPSTSTTIRVPQGSGGQSCG